MSVESERTVSYDRKRVDRGDRFRGTHVMSRPSTMASMSSTAESIETVHDRAGVGMRAERMKPGGCPSASPVTALQTCIPNAVPPMKNARNHPHGFRSVDEGILARWYMPAPAARDGRSRVPQPADVWSSRNRFRS